MGTKLVRSNKDRKILGVCGGIAEYLHIDSTLVRIIWAVAVCCFGSGLLLYLIAGFIMPQDFTQINNSWNRNNAYNGYNEYYNYDNNYNTNYESPKTSNSQTGYYSNNGRNNLYYNNDK